MDILDSIVASVTRGRSLCARAEQRELYRSLCGAFTRPDSSAPFAGEAPTGLGKSAAAFAAVAQAWLTDGSRSVISTGTHALMNQLWADMPAMLEGVRAHSGRKPVVAFLRGTVNYVDPGAIEATARGLLACHTDSELSRMWQFASDDLKGTAPGSDLERLYRLLTRTIDTGPDARSQLARKFASDSDVRFRSARQNLVAMRKEQGGVVEGASRNDDDDEATAERAFDIILWGLSRYCAGNEATVGDKHEYGHEPLGWAWEMVSADSDSKYTGKKYLSKYFLARAQAATADILVTNHSMLAVQAAHDATVILGNTRLGPFKNLLVDEAHDLPGEVRKASEVRFDGRAVANLVKQVQRHRDVKLEPGWARQGAEIAVAVELAARDTLNATIERGTSERSPSRLLWGRDESVRADGLDSAIELVQKWALSAAGPLDVALAAAEASGDTGAGRLRRSIKRVQALGTIRDRVVPTSGRVAVLEPGKSEQSFSKWLSVVDLAETVQKRAVSRVRNDESYLDSARGESARRWHRVTTTTFDTSWLLREHLYRPPMLKWHDRVVKDDGDIIDAGWRTVEGKRDRMRVALISATLHDKFPREAASSGVTRIASPLAAATRASAFFTPSLSENERSETLQVRRNGGASIKKTGHISWASTMICEAVVANGGRALVLASTDEAATAYAVHLRDHPNVMDAGLTIWGKPLGTTSEGWIADRTGVFVGSRGHMTGVDARGTTCTLVIVDKVPRNPPNEVDAARKKITGTDAAELDATALLRQAVGRLIRSESDFGTFLFLDPRAGLSSGYVPRLGAIAARGFDGGIRCVPFSEIAEHLRAMRDKAEESERTLAERPGVGAGELPTFTPATAQPRPNHADPASSVERRRAFRPDFASDIAFAALTGSVVGSAYAGCPHTVMPAI